MILAQEPPAVVAAKEAVTQKPASRPRLGSGDGYDWDLFKSLLANSNLQTGQLTKHQAALYQVAGFYGLQPPGFCPPDQSRNRCYDGKIDLNQLRRLAEQSYTRQHSHMPNRKLQPRRAKSSKC